MFAWDYEQVFNYEMNIKRDSSSIASKRVYPIGIMCMWQAKQEKKNRAKYMIAIKALIFAKACFDLWWDSKWQVKDFVNKIWYAYA